MTRAELYDLYKDDWQFADAVELVSWTPRGGSVVANIRAVRGDLAKSALRLLGQEFAVLSFDIVMLLWDNTITGTPRPNSAAKETLTDANNVAYTVEYATKVAYDTQWVVGLKLKV